MKKRFMILPPFLVIFTMYGALPDVSAATEGTTGITETTLQEPILNEPPPGIQLPETVMETNDASTPTTTPTEYPPAEVTVSDNQIPETSAVSAEPLLTETADPQPTTTETTPPATTPAEEAILPEATGTTPTTTETAAPDTIATETILPVAPTAELPTEQPAAATEQPMQ